MLGPVSVVDLRSDTVTLPTPEMREAMARAPLGDDVLGDDPTVRRLEEMAAARVGMEEAVFVPSGTMGNQIALATHCRPGDSALFEEDSHMVWYEVGAPGAIAGVTTLTLASEGGVMRPEDIERRLLKRSLHTPGTRLVGVENTHNRAGGAVTHPERLAAYRAIADRRRVVLHLDGARVFNAAVALRVDVRRLTSPFDSASFCLSKGLGAPVGSVLCGTAGFIEEARYWRKRLGGGMRQSGLLAACGIVALERMVDRLAEDHARARRLAEALAGVEGLLCDPDKVATNIVIVDTVAPGERWIALLESKGVRAIAFAEHRIRLVLHYGVDDPGLDRAIDAFREVAPQIGN